VILYTCGDCLQAFATATELEAHNLDDPRRKCPGYFRHNPASDRREDLIDAAVLAGITRHAVHLKWSMDDYAAELREAAAWTCDDMFGNPPELISGLVPHVMRAFRELSAR